MNNIPNKRGLVKYLEFIKFDPCMVWVSGYDYDYNNDKIEQHDFISDTDLDQAVSDVQSMLNESKISVKEIEYIYKLTLPMFPEGLWFLFSIVTHPKIDNEVYINKLKAINFGAQHDYHSFDNIMYPLCSYKEIIEEKMNDEK